jgi:hypothetical protein
MFGGDLSRMFALKCILKQYPFSCIAVFGLSVTFIFCYLIKILEGPVWSVSSVAQVENIDFRSVNNCLWYVLITMTTTGYGDYYPLTNPGRAVGICCAFSGTIIMSVMIIGLNQTLMMSTMESRTVDFVDRLNTKDFVKTQASQFFKYTFKYLIAKNKYTKKFNQNPKPDEKTLKTLRKNLEKVIYERIFFKKSFRRLIQ